MADDDLPPGFSVDPAPDELPQGFTLDTPNQEPPLSFGGWLKNNVGVPVARAGINAVTALPLMAEDFGVAARNVIEGRDAQGNYPYQLPSQTVQQAMQPYLPAPTSTAGRLSEAANSMILGSAAGAAGIPGMTGPTHGNVPDSFVSPSQVPKGLTPAQQRAADQGTAMGMRLTPGQETGSTALQQFEAHLRSIPATSGPFNRLAAGNQNVLDQSWANRIGESGIPDSVTLSQAADRTGLIFENARNPNSIVMQSPDVTKNVLDQIDTDFEGLIPGSIRSNPLVARFESMTGQGAINGEQLGQLSSQLGRAANNQMTGMGGDRELGQALYAVKDHADDLLQSTLSGEDAAAYAAARQQYRGLMQLTARTTNVNPSTGHVGGTSMANYLQMKDRPGFLYGNNQSPAYNATRFAQAFKPIVGDSGTATRSESGLASMALAIPGNLASWAYLNPAAPLVRSAVAIPRAMSDAVTNGLPPAGLQGLSSGIAAYMQN